MKTKIKSHQKISNRGITLIALIITIIVMLILVAVTVQIVVDSGLFGHAGRAVDKYAEEQRKESELGTGKITINGVEYESYDEFVNGKSSTLIACPEEDVETAGFLGNTSILRVNIENVTIQKGTEGHSLEDENCWDVSAAQDGSIIAWYTDNDSDSYYEVTIASENRIKANEDSEALFAYIGYNVPDETTIVGISNLDTTSVTSMRKMFFYCGYQSMRELDLGNNFYTNNVTTMSRMFMYCGYTAMTTLNLGSNFDTSNVTNMGNMFERCGYTAMTSLDLGDKFDTSKVEYMDYMFSNCGNLAMTNLNLRDKFNTINVTDMKGMFNDCGYTAMTSLSLGDKFDTTNVTDMDYMFQHCGYTAMTSLDLGDKFDTSNVTTMSAMFGNCGYTALTSLDLGDKFDTSKATNMEYMFENCGRLEMTNLNLGSKFKTSQIMTADDIYHIFNGCGSVRLETITYENTLTTFTTDCANILTEESEAYLISSNFNKCSEVTCTDGVYTMI